MTSHDCLDCTYCKISRLKGYLYCSAGLWLKASNGEEKIVTLGAKELKHIKIKWRDLFRQGKSCKFIEVE